MGRQEWRLWCWYSWKRMATTEVKSDSSSKRIGVWSAWIKMCSGWKKFFLSTESDTKILQSIYFAYKVGIISSYSNRIFSESSACIKAYLMLAHRCPTTCPKKIFAWKHCGILLVQRLLKFSSVIFQKNLSILFQIMHNKVDQSTGSGVKLLAARETHLTITICWAVDEYGKCTSLLL